MNNSKTFLGTEPVGSLLLRLALPTVAAQIINMLYNIVDRIYIGHIPGEGALALTGVGVCMPLIMIVSAFASLVGHGGAPRASIPASCSLPCCLSRAWARGHSPSPATTTAPATGAG